MQAKSAISANPSESKNEKFVEAKLRDLIQRQSKLISELKRQCLLVADKLVRFAYRRAVDVYSKILQRLKKKKRLEMGHIKLFSLPVEVIQ